MSRSGPVPIPPPAHSSLPSRPDVACWSRTERVRQRVGGRGGPLVVVRHGRWYLTLQWLRWRCGSGLPWDGLNRREAGACWSGARAIPPCLMRATTSCRPTPCPGGSGLPSAATTSPAGALAEQGRLMLWPLGIVGGCVFLLGCSPARMTSVTPRRSSSSLAWRPVRLAGPSSWAAPAAAALGPRTGTWLVGRRQSDATSAGWSSS